jgi:hypothetical protein
MIIHSRFVPFDADADELLATEEHVRAHLSSVASVNDSETEYADEVSVVQRAQDDGVLVYGVLDREPNAPYLRDDDFDPEQDVADNPLSVPSILEGQ